MVKIDFSQAEKDGNAVTGWTYKGKFGTEDATFEIQKMDGVKVLRLTSRKSTGSLLYDISGIDLKKYPYMSWKWRVDVLPKDADGEDPDKDDQAIGIYIGSGSSFSQESLALRWETRTGKGKSGFVKYGMGMVKVHWVCVRNEKDGLKRWYVDECNLYEELKKIFKGNVPRKNVAITLSANSQYTGTSSDAYLEYIAFSKTPLNQKPVKNRK
ncbi:MAG: DUF3047 domain-containing protein [Lentisphaeria bacterium]|nr:DUF3047 domain-containing protein [Lentisphaeria bacterium]